MSSRSDNTTRKSSGCTNNTVPPPFSALLEMLTPEQGPIVRITPFEVHISDPNYVNELYSMKARLDKDPWFYSWLDRNGSSFATSNSDLHKLRSAPIKKALSSTGIARVEHVLKRYTKSLITCIEKTRDLGQPISVEAAYRSFAVDVITEISCPSSLALIDTPDMGHSFHLYVRTYTVFIAIWNRHFPFIAPIVNALPRWAFAMQGETALNIYDSNELQMAQAKDVIKNEGKPISSKAFPVIMNEVYKSEDLPASEKTPQRLFEEITILVGAGSETTSYTLLNITYYVLANPDILSKLQAELKQNFTAAQVHDVLSYKQLEALPYLTAVITEGLRIASAVSGRFPRINRFHPMTYQSPRPDSKTYVIPPGSVISMSHREIHYNPEIYPSPSTFDPERFVGENKAANMKWFSAFGRGPRGCVGQNLAWAELYMVIGNLFARFELRLAEGVEEADVLTKHDCFSPFIDAGRRGVLLDVA